MARNDVYLNINALSPADAVVTGQQDMTAATVPELVLGDTPTFNFLFTDNTNVWPSWAGNASYTLTWALSDAVAGDFAPAATTGNATPITGGWSVILPLNSYDLVGLLNTKRVGQPYPVQNLWQQLRVTDPSGNEVTRAMFWTPVRYRAISDTQNTESASPTGGRFVTVNNVNTLTTPTAAQFYAANPVPTSALGTAANGELLIGNGTGFTKATLTAGSGVSITNGSGSITISATDGDITLDDGTAAAPSLKFTADTDTGIYRPSDNVVGISAGGVSRATFGATSAINGTTIPGSKTLVVTTDKLSALAATTSAELAGVISDETGSGALVFATSPTLTTPILGTPQSGTLSSCTGLPISTGVSGLGTNVATFLATPSSANLASAVTDETGTGALVFANTPTLVTPNIGAATGTSVNLTGSGTLGTTLTVNSTTDSSSKDTGAIVTEGGLGVEKSATIGGNLTVSGGTITGGASGMSLASGGTNQNITLTPSGNGFAQIVGGSLAVATFIKGGGFAQGVSLGTTGSVPFVQGYASNTFGSFANLTLQPSGSNVLIGTTTDVAAYKLNVYGATSANVIAANGVTPDGTKTGGSFGTALGGTGGATGSYALAGDIAGRFVMNAYGNNFIYEAASMQAEITTGGNTDRNLHVAALDFYTKPTASNTMTRKMRLTGTGNLILSSTGTDSGNGKIQLADHSTSAGGIGFGTDTSLYRANAGQLYLDAPASTSGSFWVNGGSGNASASLNLYPQGTGLAQVSAVGANSLLLRTNNTTALTLDSSQNATFAGIITTQSSGTGSGLVIKRNANPYVDFYDGGTSGTIRAEILADNDGVSGGNFKIQTRNNAGTMTLAATFDKAQNATFAGTLTANGRAIVDANGDSNARQFLSGTASSGAMITDLSTYAAFKSRGAGGVYLLDASNNQLIKAEATTGNTSILGSITTSAPTGGAGAWELGVYSATAPTATGYVTIEIGGVQYKLLAST